MRRPRGQDGNALVEFTYLAVLLMVPLAYLLLAVFQVQAGAFGVTEAARQAGRAFVLAADEASGRERAAAAARLVLQDQGLREAAAPEIVCALSVEGRCTQVRVRVSEVVPLPVVGALLPAGRGGVRVTGIHVTGFDQFTERAQ